MNNIVKEIDFLKKAKLNLFKKNIKNIRRKLLNYYKMAHACEISHKVFKFNLLEGLKYYDYDFVVSPYQFAIEIKTDEKIVSVGFNKKAIWVDYEETIVEDFKRLNKFKFKGFTQQEMEDVCEVVYKISTYIDEVVKVIGPYIENEVEKYLNNLR